MEQSCVGADIHVQLSQAKCVGAAPLCPPERPRSGVSIPKIHALCAGNLTTDAPLWGDTGGHIGTAPTNLHNIFPRNPIQTKFRPCAIHPKRNQPSMCNPSLPISIKPCGVPLPIVHSMAPNHVVCHHPIGVILSIAQGWQVQRSLPWVTMQARRLPTTWVVLSFATH